jgi:hypothetical protein
MDWNFIEEKIRHGFLKNKRGHVGILRSPSPEQLAACGGQRFVD